MEPFLGAQEGLHELVGDAGGVGALHSGHRVALQGGPAQGDGVIGPLHPLPALVPVHGVVAAADGGDLPHPQAGALVPELPQVARPRRGGDVPPVQEAVDIHPAEPLVPGHLQQGEQVGDVAVDPAVGQQAHQVQGGAPLPAVLHGVQQDGVAEEVPRLDVPADPGQVLEHHPAGADVGVAHLGVAHLPLGQAHVQAGGGQLAVGGLGCDVIQMRGGGVSDGVARLAGP